MKTRTVTVREGERLGDVDLNHESFSVPSSGDQDWQDERIRRFREMCEGIARGEKWEATVDGGWPRVGWGEVLDIGMYDGWPYWKPMPSFFLRSWLGGEWHSWHSLTEARKAHG